MEFTNGQQVKYKNPEQGEEDLIFTIVDDSDADCLLIQAINSTLTYPPIEEINANDLILA